ncbi:PadR family transcriptional regulator [Novosphingobium sp. CF614]|uniref:PadR family transcriptional regulator n=1 Tax=Novosphingobium sp. CF614 TaxID=1884364 RepID=UPI000B890F6A|nr:PadR family transcriptional regulator [Novosphingobium sp. CF614]
MEDMFNHIRGRGRRCRSAEAEDFQADEFRAMHGGRPWRGMARGPSGPGRGGFGGEFAGDWGMGPGAPGGPFGGGRGRFMRGARRKRLFDQAELQALLLALIVEAPRHGYDLIREIEAISGGDYAPSPGVVYPALTYMEESGLIAIVAEEGARKSYQATPEGHKQAQADAEKAASLKARLTVLAEARDRVDPAPVRRAMHALKTAVFDRLAREGVDRELVLQIADAIDEATRRIERIEG